MASTTGRYRAEKGFSVEHLDAAYDWHFHSVALLNGRNCPPAQFKEQFVDFLRGSSCWTIYSPWGGAVGMVIAQPIYQPTSNLVRDWELHVALARSAWGKQVIEQVAGGILQDLFSSPHVLRVSGWTLSSNTPSKALMKRLGFRHEGTQRSAIQMDGKIHDLHLYGITRQEFLEHGWTFSRT